MKKIFFGLLSIFCVILACGFTYSDSNSVHIIMVGDDLLHTPVYQQGLQSDGSYDLNNIFENVSEDIKNADISIINQETIFINDKNKLSSYPCFGSPVETGDAIVNAGFDVVCHATNHSVDKGISGIIDTCTFWDENYPDIIRLGIHKDESESDVSFLEKNDIKFSFVNYTYGLNGLESRIQNDKYAVDMLSDSDIEDTMKMAVQNSEVCIAILHAGTEYVYEPTNYQKEQINRFIDMGADVVICMHPHVIEPFGIVETENGNSALVYYSLGNFVSAQNEVPRVLGGMADFTITKEYIDGVKTIKISSFDMVPLVTHQEKNNYTVYKLDDYPAELESKHILRGKGFSKQKLTNLYHEITDNKLDQTQNFIITSENKQISTLDLMKFSNVYKTN